MPAGVAAAAAFAAVPLLPMCAVVPALAPGGALVAAVIAVGAGAVARGAGPAEVAAVVAVAGVIALRLLPRLVSRAFAGQRPHTDPSAVDASARGWRLLLDSLSGGTVVVVLGAAVTLLAGRTGYGAGLAVASAAALLLRALSYRFVAEALPPAVAAGLAVEHVGSVMIGEVNKLMSALEGLGAAQWGGDAAGAAAAFRTAKDQWNAAHMHLQKALDDIASGLKDTSAKYDQAEQDSKYGITRAVQGLTYR